MGKVSALGPSGWQCGKSSSEVQCWNRIEAVSQMKTPWDFFRGKPRPIDTHLVDTLKYEASETITRTIKDKENNNVNLS